MTQLVAPAVDLPVPSAAAGLANIVGRGRSVDVRASDVHVVGMSSVWGSGGIQVASVGGHGESLLYPGWMSVSVPHIQFFNMSSLLGSGGMLSVIALRASTAAVTAELHRVAVVEASGAGGDVEMASSAKAQQSISRSMVSNFVSAVFGGAICVSGA